MREQVDGEAGEGDGAEERPGHEQQGPGPRPAGGAGGEIGGTGFAGRDLAALPAGRVRIELSSAQAALAARAGITTPLLVVPSAATRDTVDLAAIDAARTATGRGYALVAGSAPASAGPGDVAVVVVDAGAPARLEALLTRLDREGLRPAVVSEVAGMAPPTVNPPAGPGGRLNALAVVAAVRTADAVAALVGALFVPLAALIAVRALAAVGLALRHARRRREPDPWTGPVTVVVPAYNEAAGIEAALRSLVASDWPHGLSVIVVDDGSTDATAEIVAGLGLAGVHLVRQLNQGKPTALNAGLALAATEVVVMVDGDTVFEPGTLAELVAPFADPRVGASSGNAKVANRGSLLGRWQHIEYVMGFNLDRRLLATVGAIPTVPGAAGRPENRRHAERADRRRRRPARRDGRPTPCRPTRAAGPCRADDPPPAHPSRARAGDQGVRRGVDAGTPHRGRQDCPRRRG